MTPTITKPTGKMDKDKLDNVNKVDEVDKVDKVPRVQKYHEYRSTRSTTSTGVPRVQEYHEYRSTRCTRCTRCTKKTKTKSAVLPTSLMLFFNIIQIPNYSYSYLVYIFKPNKLFGIIFIFVFGRYFQTE